MKQRIMNTKNQSLERSCLSYFVLQLCVHVLTYVFQLALIYLSPDTAQYGEINALLSLFVIFGVSYTILSLAAARYFASAKNKSEIGKLLIYFCKIAILLSVILLLVGIVGSGWIANLLHIAHKPYIYGVFLCAIAMIWLAIFQGGLQGRKNFIAFGLQAIITIAIKLILSIVFCLLQFYSGGVLLATFVGIIVSLAYSMIQFYPEYEIDSDIELSCKREIIQYMTGMIIVQSGLSLFLNGDVLLVDVFFDKAVTGLYSSAAMMGKIITYITGAVVVVLFPMVAEMNSQGKSVKKMFYKALLYGGGLSIAGATVLLIFGKFIIEIMFGDRYLGAYEYLSVVCMYILPYTFVYILSYFITAMGWTKVISISFLAGTVLCAFVVLLFHENLNQMFGGIAIVIGLMFAINVVMVYNRLKSEMRDT